MHADFHTFIAIAIFVLTLTVVIWQPRGLGIGWIAATGAILAYLFKIVDLHDVIAVTGIVWNATITFICIIIISMVLDEIGFFEWAALKMAHVANGNGRRMFLFTILLGAIVSAFFANDGAALILTPIVLAMVRTLRLDERYVLPFIMASGFIADTTSTPLVISNLVNIVSADFFDITFARYLITMLVPTLFALAASAIVLFGYFRKQIPLTYEHHLLQPAQAAIKDTRLFKMSWYLLALLLAAYFVSSIFHLPVSVFAVVATIIFLLAARNSKAIPTKRILKSAPWKIVVFSIGMYVVVYGLQNVGLTAELGDFVQRMADKGMFVATMGMGFLAAILSSVMNNMPTVMIDALAIKSVHTSQQVHEALVYANVVGSDLGPKITPIGSLATLLWLHVLSQKGIKITWGYYFKVGVLLTIPVLAVTSFGLYVWLTIIQ